MTHPRPDRLYAELVAALVANTGQVPAALNHLHRLIATHDGWPAHGDGEVRGRSAHSSVESAAGALLNLGRDAAEIRRAIGELDTWTRRLLAVVHRYAAPPAPLDEIPERCTGGTTVDDDAPPCDAPPATYTLANGRTSLRRGGLCEACYRRQLRHEASGEVAA